MPIEFRCPSCSKLLRTPDQSAGKKAKCPQCGGIADVPLVSTASTGDPGMRPGAGDPLAPVPPVMPSAPGSGAPAKPFDSPFDYSASSNPYASPGYFPATPEAIVGRGPLTPRKVSFDGVVEPSWNLFKSQMGPFAVFGLVLIGVNIGLQIFSQAGSAIAQTTGEPAIFITFTVLNTVLGFLVQTWITIGTAIYMLKAARDEGPTINDLGKSGPFYLRGLLVQIVIGLISAGILLLCLSPAGVLYATTRDNEVALVAAGIGAVVAFFPVVFLFYSWLLAMYFIIDRNTGVMEALSQSRLYMQGNRLMSFLILLVVGLLGTLASLFTCCVGYIWFIPYMSLVPVVIYLTATGQPWGQQKVG